MDAVEHENLAAEHGVEGYPTFLWFDAANKDEDGDVEPHEYRGGREADFAAFVMRRSGEPSDEIVDALAAAQWAVSFASAHEDRIGGSRSDRLWSPRVHLRRHRHPLSARGLIVASI